MHHNFESRKVSFPSAGRVSVGSGFVTADVLLIGRDRVRANQTYAGGSCGNVLSILSYLNWTSYPVARLGGDRRATAILDDLKSFNVRTTFISNGKGGVTPTIIVRLTKDTNGQTKSKFEWKDPHSGAWLPRYRPLPKRVAEEVRPQLPEADVFYFDRAEPSSLMLAQDLKQKGAIIFFEPSSFKEGDRVFEECLEVADVLKYSSDRIPTGFDNLTVGAKIEIQTLGDHGLRYRRRQRGRVLQWKHLPALDPIPGDSTGCGDWCSAGVIEKICGGGRAHFEELSEACITNALKFGQALATLNVAYDGARGPMYHLSSTEAREKAEAILSGQCWKEGCGQAVC